MKWYALAIFAALAALPATVSAQTVLPIGNIAKVDDKSAMEWGQSGYEILKVQASDGDFTPIMRAETFDARTVEILSRTQAPRLRGSDVHTMQKGGHVYILIRQYLLLEVKSQDAKAEGMSKGALAKKWASAISRVLPSVAPQPSQFGV